MHGVNLDQLGRRDPAQYGSFRLTDLEEMISGWGHELAISTRFFQTNSEREFIEFLHQADDLVDALILNPGAWTHYSWAIHDALQICKIPAVEVHISDLSQREQWRQHSVISDLCFKTISGQGADGYKQALQQINERLSV